MVFSSQLFIFYFLPLALGLYYAAPLRLRPYCLIVTGYIFYGWANPWFVILMFVATMIDYTAGNYIVGRWRIPWIWKPDAEGKLPEQVPQRQRKFALVTALTMNLALLGFFKYLGFAETNLNYLLSWLGKDPVSVFSVVLPVGISFYTFQSMSYSIDLYRGEAREAMSFPHFASWVCMYPHLVAGPIVRYQDIAEQLRSRTHTWEKFSRGVFFFSFGMAKKVLLANSVGPVADAAFGAGSLSWHQAWVGVTAYAFQIYFDFSGYSDMAVGLGLMLGFAFRRNFNLPYLSRSITEFWRRWHISLSTWLRENIYISLGGNRHGAWRTYRNLALVMLIGGLWHGAKWTFVIWGAIHGALLAAERWRARKPLYSSLPGPIPVLATFVVVLITWVFFRATSFGGATEYLGAMFGLRQPGPQSALLDALVYAPRSLIALAVCALLHVVRFDTWDLARDLRPAKLALAGVVLLVSVAVLFTQSYNPFLYFQF